MNILRSIGAACIGLFLGLLITSLAGENPLQIFFIFMKASFGTTYDFGLTLAYSAPLILTGLSVALAFKSGLFNIGAEGQLTMGALATALAGGVFSSIPAFLAPLFAIICAVLAGGIWGGIAGYLKAKRGAHEVITTIMLNFTAAGIASYVTMNVLKDPHTQSPQTVPIAPQYSLHQFAFFQGAPVTYAIFISIFAAVLTWIFIYRTPFGYEMRAVGENESAASTAGISVKKIYVYNMFLSGGLAGLVGVGEVLGKTGCFKLDFSPAYGFTGIAVAFLGRGNPLAILFSGFLFGVLQKGSNDLEIYAHNVTSELSLVLQAFIILAVAADGLWEKVFKTKKVT